MSFFLALYQTLEPLFNDLEMVNIPSAQCYWQARLWYCMVSSLCTSASTFHTDAGLC